MQTLKRKAAFTALSRLINTISGFFTQIILTPFILAGLGQYLFGVYSLINKTEGYMSFVDLRPSAILRYKLAFLQGTSDLSEKRKFIGAAIHLSIITFPIIIFVGIILCYFFPFIFKIANEYINISRAAVIWVAIFLGLKSFLGIPDAILRGNNLEYKGIFIEPARNILYIALILTTLHFNYGLLGVIFASFASFLIAFILKLVIQIKELPEYSPLKPEKKHTNEISAKGGWYLFSSFSFQLLQSLDVIIIGLFFSPVMVTVFSLTKALSFRVSESVVTISGSISSGLGDLIGKQENLKLRNLRADILRINLLVSIALFLYFYFFNRAFVNLWVGNSNYTGTSVNLVICLTIPFIILSMSSQLFIDAYLKFKEKSLSVFISSLISIMLALALVKVSGLIGVAVAILIGRIVLWLQFEYLINKELSWEISLRNITRSTYAIFFLILVSSVAVVFLNDVQVVSWADFIIKTALFFLLISPILFFLGLHKKRKDLYFWQIERCFYKNNKMSLKILMVGSFSQYIYEEALCEELAKENEVVKYAIDDFSLISKIRNYRSRNNDFIKFVEEQKPDVIFFYRVNSFLPSTIIKIRKSLPDLKLILYHNDNPYIGLKNKLKYFFFLSLIPSVDLVYCYRKSNLAHVLKRGGKKTKLFLPHFCTKIHFRKESNDTAKTIDVVFIGHYAADGRADYIEALIKNGIAIKVFGKWQQVAAERNWPADIVGGNVYNDEYSDTIASAQIALCFLSKKNADGYTRRCFEIPAIGTLLMSEYTEELSTFFIEDKEAVFFRNPNELVQKVGSLLKDSSKIDIIRAMGHAKVKNEHSEKRRVEMLLNDLSKI